MKKKITLALAALLSFGAAQADLYIIGEANGNGWATNVGVPMTASADNANVYTIEDVSLTGWFAFATQLCEGANDWDELNGNYRYGPADGTIPEDNVAISISQASTSFQVASIGTYDITVDMDALTATFVNTTAPVVAGDVLYLVGSPNGWDITDGSCTLAKTAEGVYDGSFYMEIAESADAEGNPVTVYPQFRFYTELGDWDANCIGSQVADAGVNAVFNGDTYTGSIVVGGKGSWVMPQTATYDITVNLNDNTIVIVGDGMTISYPEQLYVLGNVEGCGWDPSVSGVALAGNNGVYEGSMTITGTDYGYFAFGATLGADADDWNTFNAHRYGPVVQNTEVILNEPTDIGLNGDRSYKMVPDTYWATIDLPNGTLTMTDGSGISKVVTPAARAIAGKGVINISGNAGSVKVYNLGGAIVGEGRTVINCPAGAYIVTIDGRATKVIVK